MEKPSSFVRNCVATKNRINADHFKNILSQPSFTKQKFKLLRHWTDLGINPSKMTEFKTALFNLPSLKENHLVPVDEFWETAEDFGFRSMFETSNPPLLSEIIQVSEVNL